MQWTGVPWLIEAGNAAGPLPGHTRVEDKPVLPTAAWWVMGLFVKGWPTPCHVPTIGHRPPRF